MKYNQAQLDAVCKMMREKYMAGEAESHEIAVSLTAAVTAGRMTPDEMKYILCSVFYNNTKGIITALKRAEQLIDEKMISNIIS